MLLSVLPFFHPKDLSLPQFCLSFMRNYKRHFNTDFRSGFSLLEMSLAIVIISAVLITGITMVVGSLNLQREADRLALAMSLVQTKIADLRSDKDLAATDDAGEFSDSESIYYGYKWETKVTEEKLNLNELLESNFGGLGDEDQLAGSFRNEDNKDDSQSKQGLFALAELPILRIHITVTYPKTRGSSAYGTYNVETWQRSTRSRIYQTK